MVAHKECGLRGDGCDENNRVSADRTHPFICYEIAINNIFARQHVITGNEWRESLRGCKRRIAIGCRR